MRDDDDATKKQESMLRWIEIWARRFKKETETSRNKLQFLKNLLRVIISTTARPACSVFFV